MIFFLRFYGLLWDVYAGPLAGFVSETCSVAPGTRAWQHPCHAQDHGNRSSKCQYALFLGVVLPSAKVENVGPRRPRSLCGVLGGRAQRCPLSSRRAPDACGRLQLWQCAKGLDVDQSPSEGKPRGPRMGESRVAGFDHQCLHCGSSPDCPMPKTTLNFPLHLGGFVRHAEYPLRESY